MGGAKITKKRNLKNSSKKQLELNSNWRRFVGKHFGNIGCGDSVCSYVRVHAYLSALFANFRNFFSFFNFSQK